MRMLTTSDTVAAVRILLGLQYLLNGLNWYYKILPFPSLSDDGSFVMKHQVAAAMIETGWMFSLTKLIEFVTGVSLLLNRFVPLMLVVSITVAVTTFLLDAMIGDDLLLWIQGNLSGGEMWAKLLDAVFFGGVVLIMQAYLMFAYLDVYRPMLAARVEPGGGAQGQPLQHSKMLKGLGLVALLLGLVASLWYLGMVKQWLIPWSSLAVFAPRFY